MCPRSPWPRPSSPNFLSAPSAATAAKRIAAPRPSTGSQRSTALAVSSSPAARTGAPRGVELGTTRAMASSKMWQRLPCVIATGDRPRTRIPSSWCRFRLEGVDGGRSQPMTQRDTASGTSTKERGTAEPARERKSRRTGRRSAPA